MKLPAHCPAGHKLSWWSWRTVYVPTPAGPVAARGWWRRCFGCAPMYLEGDQGKLAPQRWNVLKLHALAPDAKG
jgi:hypothetical protein